MSLTMVSLGSVGLQASPGAPRIMTSAVLDDIGSLILVANVVPLVTSDAALTRTAVSITIGSWQPHCDKAAAAPGRSQ